MIARIRGGLALGTPAVLLSAALLSAILAAPSFAIQPGKERRAERVPDSYIVVYRGSVADPRTKTEKLERGKGFKARFRYARAVKGFAAKLSDRQVAELRADPEVAFVSPDRPVKALASVPLAPGESAPTGVRRIEAATGSSARQASGANVAVLDTGIDLDHPDLNAAHGANCVGTGPAEDDNGHGTHVAGTIAAGNDGAGVVGVAPGTRLYAAKVLGGPDGSGTWSQIICGIDWATGTRRDADPANDIAVANMSLGGVGDPVEPCATTTDALHKAICNSTAAGVTYVVAAGNSGWDFDYARAPDTPAAYPEVLTVSAVSDSDGLPGGGGGAPGCDGSEADDRYASFSNYALTSAGEAHTIAAPGTCINSTWLGGGYDGTLSGTSMATPHVAGVVALCLNEGGTSGPCAGRSPAEIIQLLRAEAQTRTTATPDYGFAGDPTRPVGGRYYGYLVWPALASPDTAAPTVTSVAPPNGATLVATSTAVSVTFSEPMDRPSAETAFSLARSSDGSRVAGSFSWSGDTMTFRPSAPLAQGTSYDARVSTAAKDLAGNALSGEKAWTFKTATTITAFPDWATPQTGTRRSGSASSLTSDNNVYYEVNSTTTGTRTTSWYGRFSGVPKTLNNLRITYKGKNSRTCTQTVAIQRVSDGAWLQLSSRSVGTTEVQLDMRPGGTLSSYVDASGYLRVRVRCTLSSASFYSSGDLMKIVYDRP